MNGEFKLISRRSALSKPISDSNPQNLIWPAYPSYENPIVAFRYDRGYQINFELKGGEKTDLREPSGMSDYRIPANFKKVVVSFSSSPQFYGIAFYDKNGNEMFKQSNFDNYAKIETILGDDERLVGIASRNPSCA